MSEQPEAAPTPADDPLAALRARAEELEAQIERERRAAADAQRALLLGMLDVADALDRIAAMPAAAQPEAERQRRSIETTRRLLASRLSRAGVAPLDLIGAPHDPAFADIQGEQPADDLPDETIVREVVRAYRWHHELLRRATVVVSRRAAAADDAQPLP